MPSIHDIIKVDLSHFPTDERFIQIPGKLVLADNIDESSKITYKDNHPIYPVSVTFAATFLCLEGAIDIKIDLNTYHLSSGSSVIIIPGSFVQMLNIAQGTKMTFMAISPDFMNFVGDVQLGIEFGKKVKQCPVHKLDEDCYDEYLHTYKTLKRKLTCKEYHLKEEVAKSYLHIIQCNALNSFLNETGKAIENKPINRKEELFMQFMKEVKKYYSENRSIRFYAEKLFVSPKYLSTIVHDVSGNHATELINQYVILEAKTMLKTKGTSIKDVSNKLNFANQSFFAKFFKQHTGYTPKEYKDI